MSGEDQAIGLIYSVLLLVLVGSAFAVRRVPMGKTLKMAAAWILIFGAFFVAFAVRNDLKALGKRVWADATGAGEMVQAGETLRIRKSDDGHFWVDARLNGEKVRFLVDSGATVTSVSGKTARRAGIEPISGFPVVIDTANGRVAAERGRAAVDVGTIRRPDLSVFIADSFGETDVLGMNFLSSLSGWGVEGEWLVLRP